MLTSHRQKYNPKKPNAKIKRSMVCANTFPFFFLKNLQPGIEKVLVIKNCISIYYALKSSKTGKGCMKKIAVRLLKAAQSSKKNPPPCFHGEGHHQNTLHLFLSENLSRKARFI